MATTRRAKFCANDAAAGSLFQITRVRARFDDPEREQRFIRQQFPLQRRSAWAAVVVMTLITMGQWPLARVVGNMPIAGSRAWILGIGAAVGFLLSLVMWSDRSPKWTSGAVVAAAFVVPGMAAVVIAVGTELVSQVTLLVAGGVFVAYFSSRLDLLASTMTAFIYSAVTIPAWLLVGPTSRPADVGYTLAVASLAHFVGVAEARRVHQELRNSFAQREDLRQLSAIDVLTGLANRRSFNERSAAAWRVWTSTGRTPTVLMLDIDHFKRLNDTLGHQAGDIALRMVADAIRGSLRKGSNHQVARYGGEEFVVLLPAEEHHVAHAIAERIGAAVRGAGIEQAVVPRNSTIKSYDRPITLSVGIASAAKAMVNPQDLIDAADRAMYRAKGDGRDCVRCEDHDAPSLLSVP
ncbi:MAG: GGDEF domain-containing protein [Nakamurella sp.]